MRWKIMAAAGALALAVLFVFDPEKIHFFPQCPFRMMTGGWLCPGCGSQRAMHALLHGEVARAFGFNALLVLSLPFVIVGVWMEWFGGKGKYPDEQRWLFGQGAAKMWLLIVVIWWISRNLFSF